MPKCYNDRVMITDNVSTMEGLHWQNETRCARDRTWCGFIGIGLTAVSRTRANREPSRLTYLFNWISR